MLRTTLLLFIVLVSGQVTKAQRDLIRFNNITIDNGLAQGSVTGIIHGSDGFIWIATADGLHRYDGYSFKIYRNDPQNKNSLPDNYISCIFEDKDGDLIIGFYSGEVAKLNKHNATFTKLAIKNSLNKVIEDPVTCINDDGNGAYLIGYDGGGLIRYDKTKKTNKCFQKNVTSGLNSNTIKSISKDNFTGNFWIGTSEGLCEYVTAGQSFVRYKNFSNLDNKTITTVLTSNADKILIGTYGKGLYEYIRGSDSASRIELPKSKGSRFVSFLISSNDKKQIWIGTQGGIYKWEESRFTLYTNNPSNPESLVDNYTQSVTIDRFGSIWIGTINGLSRFDPRLKLFNLYREFKWQDSLLSNNVYCIYEDPAKTLWLGTLSSGIIKFDPVTEKIVAWPVIKTETAETKMARAIYKDVKGQMWIGSRDGGLFKFFPDQNRFEQVKGAKGFEISSPTIRSIYEDKAGNLWIGTANGLNIYDRQTNHFEVYRAFKDIPNNNSIYQIKESQDGQSLYLACFRGGFQIFNKRNKSFKLFSQLIPAEKTIGKSYAMCFELIENDSVMIGTYGGGLFIMNMITGGSRNITEKQGLANNSIYGILRHKNVYWLSTNRGLSSYNYKTGEIRNFGLKNYIQSNEYNEGAYCKTSDGVFYFGGVNGFNYFKPQNFPSGIDNSKTEITLIRKGEEEIPISINSKGQRFIELNYNDNLISFEFATLNFIPSLSNKYAYKMEGFDDKWIKAGSRTVAYYTKLSPGKYVFRVKPLDGDIISKSKGAFIQIIIEPPFWQTWWFYILLALVFIGLIYIVIKWRTQIVDRNYQHKLAELELKALRSQMNPHFIFNSLNSIQYFILKKEPRAAYDYLTKFSSLMRMILQNSKHKSITLKAEYDWLKTYLELENLRMEGTLIYEINLDKELHPERIFVPTMVLQPYVENAIIHGLLPKTGDKKLSIDVSSDGQNLKCVITDNGIGREQSHILNKARLKQHESTAMSLTRDRLAILNIEAGEGLGPAVTDLYDSAGNSMGTKVELVLPLIIQNENIRA
jgi:ligand-binding sensor domain-containing protein